MSNIVSVKPLLVLLVCLVCTHSSDDDLDEPFISLTDSNNKFSLNLFKECAADYREPNLLISPLSTYITLAMVADGSDGRTYQQLHRVLGLPNYNVDLSFKSLLDELNDNKEVELSVANKALVADYLDVNSEFQEKIQRDYSSSVDKFDPKNVKQTVKDVNNWASEVTHAKVPKVISEDDIGNLEAVLLNAVYFKADWALKFDKKKTVNLTFRNQKSRKTVKMMQNTLKIYTGRLLKLKAKFAVLPYKNEDYKMTIILPNKNSNVEEVTTLLGPSLLNDINRRASLEKTELTLPKFKIQSSIDLINVVKKLGIEDLFTERADLSRLTHAPGFHVDKIKQDSFIDVNEEGSQAAAVSVVGMQSKRLERPKTFKVDRPSIFLITKKNMILFIGYLKDPVQ